MINPVESLASAVYSAIHKDLPDIEYRGWTPVMKKDGVRRTEAPIKTRRPYTDDVEVFHFPQTWSSTALGFGGMGGSSMTTAYTTVVLCGRKSAVYFDGRLAYVLDIANRTFVEDLSSHNMAPVNECSKYKK